MSLQYRSSSIKRESRSHAAALADLSPFSTLACQVEATNTWRRDLKSLASKASERFADISWTCGGEEDDGSISDGSSRASIFSHLEGTIWAHKAILYVRAPNTFQARFLQLRTPAANLGALASSSTVSLPALRAPSPSFSLLSQSSSMKSKKKSIRGNAPPSSFSMSRAASREYSMTSGDSDIESAPRLSGPRKSGSSVSLSPSVISRPITREDRRLSKQLSSSSVSTLSSPSIRSDTDALSVISSTSTIKAPLRLVGVNPSFFEATLEYLYTAEESLKETFEFLYEDRVAADESPEERLDKLRQDLVYMWRSRLYSDIRIVIGDEEDDSGTLKTIPDGDPSASVTSLALSQLPDEEEERASFSAHRMMLVSRSPYFAAQLLSPYADSDARIIRLPSPPFTPAALHFTLGFIYSGTLFFSNRTFDLSTAFQLWRAASYLQMETLSNLVSSLIAHDFCHGFTCSPPCKTCIRRVPRTLAFVSCPDVSDSHLQALARNAVSGSDFGQFWSKEVGNLDYTVRGMLVSDVCSKVDATPGYAVHVLRQLSIIGTRIDVERSSRWVDAVRWMCESVESHLCATLEFKFAEVVASKEWKSLVNGVGFLNDVLEKLLSIIIDGLTEKRAARVYEVLVGHVLLSDDGPLPNDVAVLVEAARRAIILYIQKRWVNIRSHGGFDGMETWALKELADEIDVPFNDLLRAATEIRPIGPLSRTGLQARQSSNSPVPGRSSAHARPAPGQVIDGEREPGPINLRAAVLNRSAARASTSQKSVQSGRDQHELQRTPSASSSIMDRPRRSLGPVATTGASVDAHESAAKSTATMGMRAPLRPSSVKSNRQEHGKSAENLPSTPPSNGKGKASQTSALSREALDPELTPTKATYASSSAFAATRFTPQQGDRKAESSSSKIPQMKASADKLRQKTSSASLASVSGRSTASASQTAAARGARSRQTSTGSTKVATTSAASLRKISVPLLAAENSNHAKPVRRVPSNKSIGKRREERPVPPLPTAPAARRADVSQLDKDGDVKMAHCLPLPPATGTQLALGIPCVVAPRNRQGKAVRFRATVKYIGSLKGEEDRPMVGIEVPSPLPPGVSESLFDFHDGSHQGTRYFDIGLANNTTDSAVELSHKPEREARRERLAQMLQGRTADAALAVEGPNVKRRKDLSGVSSLPPSAAGRGLFIRPNEVLWVVV